MNLKYSILWFDDTADFFESIDRSPLENEISDWGFEPEVLFVSEPEQFMQHEPFSDFDLIVVDYNLEAHEEYGSNFIRKIRDHQVFTEVVFYSSNQASDLWTSIKDNSLEGVFVANRRNVLEKIQHVAEHSVRKILDIENMRGIVMAEVGDIDKILDEIAHLAIPALSEDQSRVLFERFHAACEQQDQQKKGRLDSFIKNPVVSEMISLSDSSKRWDNFNRIRKAIPQLSEFTFGDYIKDILGPRNFLAHGVPTKTGTNEVTFSFNKKDYKFCENTGRTLRKNISLYKKQLIATYSFLSKK